MSSAVRPSGRHCPTIRTHGSAFAVVERRIVRHRHDVSQPQRTPLMQRVPNQVFFQQPPRQAVLDNANYDLASSLFKLGKDHANLGHYNIAQLCFEQGIWATRQDRGEVQACFRYEAARMQYLGNDLASALNNVDYALGCQVRFSAFKAYLFALKSMILFARGQSSIRSCDLCSGLQILQTAWSFPSFDADVQKYLILRYIEAFQHYGSHMHVRGSSGNG